MSQLPPTPSAFRLLSILVFLGAWTAALGQSTQYQVTIGGSKMVQGQTSAFLPSGNVQLSFMTRRSSGFDSAVRHFLTFSPNGQLLRKNSFASPTYKFGFINNQVALPDGYLMQGQLGTSTGDWGNMLIRVDTLGQVQWARRFSPEQQLSVLTGIERVGNRFQAVSFPAGFYAQHFYMVQGNLNGQGNILCRKYTLDTSIIFRLGASLSAPGGNTYWAFECQSSESIIVKMRDTNVVWVRRYKALINPSRMHLMSPNRIGVGLTIRQTGSNYARGAFAAIDTNGNLLAARKYDLPNNGLYTQPTTLSDNEHYMLVWNYINYKWPFFQMDADGNLSNGHISTLGTTNNGAGFSDMKRRNNLYACSGLVGSSSGLLFQLVNNPADVCAHTAYANIPSEAVTTLVLTDTLVKTSFDVTFTDIPFTTANPTQYSISMPCVTSSIEPQNAPDGPNVFPNPASQTLRIDGLSEGKSQVLIFDPVGRLLMNKQMEAGLTLDIRQLAPGYYRLKVLDKGQWKWLGFVKE